MDRLFPLLTTAALTGCNPERPPRSAEFYGGYFVTVTIRAGEAEYKKYDTYLNSGPRVTYVDGAPYEDERRYTAQGLCEGSKGDFETQRGAFGLWRLGGVAVCQFEYESEAFRDFVVIDSMAVLPYGHGVFGQFDGIVYRSEGGMETKFSVEGTFRTWD